MNAEQSAEKHGASSVERGVIHERCGTLIVQRGAIRDRHRRERWNAEQSA